MSGALVQHYLDHSAALYPQKTAITDGRTTTTFGELAAASDRLASFLVSLGIMRGDRIIYFLKRSPECITATIGILKAGAVYVPLDKKTPPERWNRIILGATPRAIICDLTTLVDTLEWTAVLNVPLMIICLGPYLELEKYGEKVFFFDKNEAATGIPISINGDPDDVAYVLYTSGSTGVPKGVMVTHNNITNYIDWALGYFNITADDHILGTAPFYFDMSTFDIFSALAAGASLCIATEELLLFPEKLVRFMEQEKITLWKGVSSLLMYMYRAGVVRSDRMPLLKTIIFAGEPFDAQYLHQWMDAFPQKSFYNGYGPTEATGVSLCYHVKRPPEMGQPIPIGKPCKGAKAILVDENDKLVVIGELGELCISGACLAKGYLNDPEKTKSRFTPPPSGCDVGELIYHTGDLCRQTPEGDYIFVSRKDLQVKWMGYRIELNEIEINLMAHPQVRSAVVLLSGTGNNGLNELVAFYEADAKIDSACLSQFLEKRVPTYMIPKIFIQVDSLPRNDRGKIDRDEILKFYFKSSGIADVKNVG
jgi:amino acid adenylation domain-containing protein